MTLALILMFLSGFGLITISFFIVYEIITNIIQSRIVKLIFKVTFIVLYLAILHWFISWLAGEYNNSKSHESISSVEKIERVKILSMTKPNHVYISVLNLETKNVTKDIYVGKFCDTMNINDIGSEVNLPVKYVTYRNGKVVLIYNTSKVCDEQ